MEDIFEFAKQMELDGKAMYEEEAAKVNNPGLKKILLMLAEEEQKHYDLFDAMKNSGDLGVLPSISMSAIKNVFQEIKDSGEKIELPENETEFYKKALEIEQKSEQFYRSEAAKQSGNVQETMIKIAEEEHRHAILMENMIQFVNRPNEWVEHAEFNHIEDY
jgi:rubrerythrin